MSNGRILIDETRSRLAPLPVVMIIAMLGRNGDQVASYQYALHQAGVVRLKGETFRVLANSLESKLLMRQLGGFNAEWQITRHGQETLDGFLEPIRQGLS